MFYNVYSQRNMYHATFANRQIRIVSGSLDQAQITACAVFRVKVADKHLIRMSHARQVYVTERQGD